jgi:hypothetical protein
LLRPWRALRKAVESFPDNLNVPVLGMPSCASFNGGKLRLLELNSGHRFR